MSHESIVFRTFAFRARWKNFNSIDSPLGMIILLCIISHFAIDKFHNWFHWNCLLSSTDLITFSEQLNRLRRTYELNNNNNQSFVFDFYLGRLEKPLWNWLHVCRISFCFFLKERIKTNRTYYFYRSTRQKPMLCALS